ncbi:MAG: esterase [Deltaproteobacteria bacterium HGW-Deltaproteobacteria-22]|jgi:pimeloyl-ACP methyl ester carboxylesterase|nr:MAG: esterase [Deltaproteobacteria bacterium HGW-Deltaproteobacteria-22]
MNRRTLLLKLALLALGLVVLAGHRGWFGKSPPEPAPLNPAPAPLETPPPPAPSAPPAPPLPPAPPSPPAPTFLPIPTDGELRIDGIEVTLLEATAVHRGDILMLPGWNFERSRWCARTRFCTLARAAGFRLVLPEMGKSVYTSEHFPETKTEWKRYPTLPWVTRQLLPELKARYGFFRGPGNFLVGLSTGARGVVLIAQATGDLFTAGAALSGDYDQTRMPADRLMTGYYGPYRKHRDRWSTQDNPTALVAQLTIPIYFGHGLQDSVVPAAQTRDFHGQVRKVHPRSLSRLHLVPAGHDFAYWDSESQAILDFFNGFLP